MKERQDLGRERLPREDLLGRHITGQRFVLVDFTLSNLDARGAHPRLLTLLALHVLCCAEVSVI